MISVINVVELLVRSQSAQSFQSWHSGLPILEDMALVKYVAGL